MASLADWCHANGDICPACGSSKMVRLDSMYCLQCQYCNLRISEEVMFKDIEHDYMSSILYQFKRQWQRRVEVIKSSSAEALYDELVARGILQPKPPIPETTSLSKLIQEIYAPIIDSQLKADLIFLHHESHTEPKPWSYEEAAASEFNLDEGTGLQ